VLCIVYKLSHIRSFLATSTTFSMVSLCQIAITDRLV